jgi:uncharacterized protein (TIGR00304 family)
MKLIKTGTILIIIGFAAVFIGTLLSIQKANIGGLIMIGPIPIAFGTSPELTIIAMLLGILLMILFFVIEKRNEQREEIDIPPQDITEGPGTKVKGGRLIFIGPIPIVFGSDKRFVIIAIILAIVLMLLAIVFH